MSQSGSDATDEPARLAPREFNDIKPDGRRYTKGKWKEGGKYPVVRAVRSVPAIGITQGDGLVLVSGRDLPPDGMVKVTRGNALDRSSHFPAPASLFSMDWRDKAD